MEQISYGIKSWSQAITMVDILFDSLMAVIFNALVAFGSRMLTSGTAQLVLTLFHLRARKPMLSSSQEAV
jgi:hypothetical protein